MMKLQEGKPTGRRALLPILSKSKVKSRSTFYSRNTNLGHPSFSNCNRYSPLSNYDDMDDLPETNINLNVSKPTVKPPPIEFHYFKSEENKMFTTYLYGLPRLSPKLQSIADISDRNPNKI